MAVRTDVGSLSAAEVNALFDVTETVDRLDKPKGGEVYVFASAGKEDWRADGYRWRQNGRSLLPKKSPVLCKVHFALLTSSGEKKGFAKHVYKKFDGSDAQRVVVQYVGDDTLHQDFPHGNSKQGTSFLSAAPTLRNKLRGAAAKSSFKELIVSSVDEQLQFQPRNARQVQYYRSIATPERKLGADTMVTLHELAYAIPGFVWSITTFPDVVVCFGIPSLLGLIRNQSLVSYDTTFNMGDFYLSVLALKVSDFRETPSIPVAFVLHDRKFQTVHSELCNQLSARLKGVNQVVLVTDGEAALVSAFTEAFPRWCLVNCWNHILRDVDMWLKRHGGKGADIAVYTANVRELLQCQNSGELSTKTATLQPSWSDAFQMYYRSHLMPRVETAYAGFLASVGLQTDSITTNMSESLNFVIKEYQGWKENTADICVLSLYRLQVYYETLVNRSSDGFGPYNLLSKDDTQAAGTPSVISTVPATTNLDEVLATVRAAANGESTQYIPASIKALSASLRVVHVPDLQIFNVSDANSQAHAVTLFPRETCTCPASTACCHIIAAKRSVGLETNVRKPLILSSLRKNSRKANDKTSGRKKPRLGDLHYAAAPDSAACSKNDIDCVRGSNGTNMDDHTYATGTAGTGDNLHDASRSIRQRLNAILCRNSVTFVTACITDDSAIELDRRAIEC